MKKLFFIILIYINLFGSSVDLDSLYRAVPIGTCIWGEFHNVSFYICRAEPRLKHLFKNKYRTEMKK